MAKVGIIDYGSGNFASVFNALKYIQADIKVLRQADDFSDESHIVLPGVGAYAKAMDKLKSLGLIEPLKREVLDRGRYFLGICVGMQILSEVGYEHSECKGLGFIPGKVDIIDTQQDVILPHMGWNELYVVGAHRLFLNMSDRPVFYFVHSFQFYPENKENVIATCRYGKDVVATIAKDNILGVQFHPEKSQNDGLRLLKNFIEL